MDATQALIEARDLIKDPARWTQGAYARDGSGDSVSSAAPEACKWCALGAVAKVAGKQGFMKAMMLSEAMLGRLDRSHDREQYTGGIAITNDILGHEAVMRMFAKAINEGAA